MKNKNKSERDTTMVRVSLETKNQIEAIASELGMTQQHIIALAVDRIKGKIKICIEPENGGK